MGHHQFQRIGLNCRENLKFYPSCGHTHTYHNFYIFRICSVCLVCLVVSFCWIQGVPKSKLQGQQCHGSDRRESNGSQQTGALDPHGGFTELDIVVCCGIDGPFGGVRKFG